jgi:acetyltransferase-like isoleucine patch superfamily enzyme
MNIFSAIVSIPKTIYLNFKVFPFKTAIIMPIFVAHNVKLASVYKNAILINTNIGRFMIKMGLSDGSKGFNHSYKNNSYLYIKKQAKIIFNGRASFSSGFSIRVDKGNMEFGNNFSCNKHCSFSCSEGIKFGYDCLIGGNVNVRDSDGHTVFTIGNEDKMNENAPVVIGNHVWLCSNVDILKGVNIPDDCVVGYKGCVTKKFNEKNSLIAGYPARIMKSNINWKL